MAQFEQWTGFHGKLWKEEVNVRDFIQNNYTQYEGDEAFLEAPTEATNKLWGELQKLQKESQRLIRKFRSVCIWIMQQIWSRLNRLL